MLGRERDLRVLRSYQLQIPTRPRNFFGVRKGGQCGVGRTEHISQANDTGAYRELPSFQPSLAVRWSYPVGFKEGCSLPLHGNSNVDTREVSVQVSHAGSEWWLLSTKHKIRFALEN